MLTKIREKSQGVFAWVILLLICIPFALWGIQNYLGGGSEPPVVTVGDKEFFERDVNNAYTQFAQSLAGMNVDEALIKKQALEKLINDEVLWQYVQDKGLVVTNAAAREFVRNLEFLQTDGKFDKTKYKALLAQQRLTPAEFTLRIKKALVMEQMQQTVMRSSFATKSDAERFFAIQNQTRDIEYIKIPLPTDVAAPSDEEILAFYEQHKDQFQVPEQVKIEYIELSLDQLAKQVSVSDEALKAYYDEHKAQYSVPEQRRISHILFKFSQDAKQDQQALARAQKAREELNNKDFATLAAKLSDDKLTAKKGGDLGYFSVGVMDEAFEQAVKNLKPGEVSAPVKSAFGYHLIKLTQLTPAKIKPFSEVKTQIADALKKEQAEGRFYELGERMAEISYENPDNLSAVAEELEAPIQKSDWFSRQVGQGIAADEAVRSAAFSEEVLKGNNSEPLELGDNRLLVIRVLDHKPAQARPLEEVKAAVIAQVRQEKARKQAETVAQQIKQALVDGQSIEVVAKAHKLNVRVEPNVSRSQATLSQPIKQAVFQAAKPLPGKPTIVLAKDTGGAMVVISVNKFTPGTISEQDKLKLKLAIRNIAKAYGQTEFAAFMKALRAQTKIHIRQSDD